MKLRFAWLLVLFCGFTVTLPASGQGKGGKGKGNSAAAALNGWLFNLFEGKRQATGSGKPLMVVFRCEP